MQAHRLARCCWCGNPFVWLEVSGTRAWLCARRGCRDRQLARAVKVAVRGGSERLLYVPLPRQVEFMESTARRVLFGGAAGGSKAVALDTLIPTPAGLRTMADLSVGDSVLDERGQPCSVVWCSPEHVDASGTYRMTFDDGSSVVAGGGHQWVTFTSAEREAILKRSPAFRAARRASRALRGSGKKPWLSGRNRAAAVGYESQPVTGQVRTTAEIADTLYVRGGSRVNHAVRLAGAWELPARELPLDPYVLGVWLGDGHTSAAHVTTTDPEILYELAQAGHPSRKLTARFLWAIDGLRPHLRALGLLGKKAVPEPYLWGAAAQRLALLQGLMDTDGSSATDGQSAFVNTNETLARAVFHLAASLGAKPTIIERRASLYGKDCGPIWSVKWTSTLPCFRLARKAERLRTALRPTQGYCYIVGCERIADAPVKCIEVDSPSHQFLCGRAGIPTHNSHALRWHAYIECLSTPNYRALILRRTYKELESTHLREAEIEAQDFGAVALTSAKQVRFPNQSLLDFGHCEDLGAVAGYLSREYDLVEFDELVTFEQQAFLMIASRARTSKPGVRTRVLSGTNPGGPQAHWVRRMFIDHDVDTEEFPNYRPEEYAYIPSKLEDNPYLNEDYEQGLLDLPPELRKAYRDGDWDIFPGQYFPEWRRTTHVSGAHLDVPADVPRVRAVDWGFVKPGWCGWFALLPDGRVYLEDEYVFSRTIGSEVAQEIDRRTRARGVPVRYTVGDTAMWTPDSQTGESLAETFARQGVPMVQADKDRLNGWNRLRHWLRPAPDGVPWLTSSPACAYVNRTMPALVSDDHKPEDVDTDGEDHAADAVRYFCMSRPMPGTQTVRAKTTPGSWGWWKQAADRQREPLGILGGR